jgi:hypothetical protein
MGLRVHPRAFGRAGKRGGASAKFHLGIQLFMECVENILLATKFGASVLQFVY